MQEPNWLKMVECLVERHYSFTQAVELVHEMKQSYEESGSISWVIDDSGDYPMVRTLH